jgi:hypothetical protein
MERAPIAEAPPSFAAFRLQRYRKFHRKCEKRRKKSAENVIFVVSLQPVPWYKKQPANFDSGGYSETWLRTLIAEA